MPHAQFHLSRLSAATPPSSSSSSPPTSSHPAPNSSHSSQSPSSPASSPTSSTSSSSSSSTPTDIPVPATSPAPAYADAPYTSRDAQFSEYDAKFADGEREDDEEFERLMLESYTKTMQQYRQEAKEKNKLRPEHFPGDESAITALERSRADAEIAATKHSRPADWVYSDYENRLLGVMQERRDRYAVHLPLGQKPPAASSTNVAGESYGMGRRKTAVAIAICRKGTGNITVNGKRYVEYFGNMLWSWDVSRPFLVTETFGDYDVECKVRGGGKSGQAGACRLAISKALRNQNASFVDALKQDDLLRRDSRRTERKHYGRYKARKGYTYVRR